MLSSLERPSDTLQCSWPRKQPVTTVSGKTHVNQPLPIVLYKSREERQVSLTNFVSEFALSQQNETNSQQNFPTKWY